MKKAIKILGITFSLIIITLVITNPTNSDFDRYLQAKGFGESIRGGRVNYFLVMSVYEVRYRYGDYNASVREIKYLGILGNFINISDN